MIRHDWWWDLVPAAAVVVGGVLGAAHIETDPGGRAADAGAYVVVAIAGLTLLARRRWPGVVLAVVTAALVAYTLRDRRRDPVADGPVPQRSSLGTAGPPRGTAHGCRS